MKTRWTDIVDPMHPWQEYPRPQMRRPNWTNLNGQWEYAIREKHVAAVETWDGNITVPFAVESALSGVGRRVGTDNRLWYRRRFEAHHVPADHRLLLHFGAVDWEATVWINGHELGTHRGGYDPFTFDITDALIADHPQELIVAVWDPTDTGDQPRGKQSSNPHGIWYEAVTGIWQTVWLESVPSVSIASLKIVSDIDTEVVRVTVKSRGTVGDDHSVRLIAREGASVVAETLGNLGTELALRIPAAKLWSPHDPFLYDLTVQLESDGHVVDRVDSYVGMRKIEVGTDQHGRPKLLLNNEAIFQYGPLDQGWWPDGLYTAPTDEALRYDIEVTRELGFNMIRKHVKVEPARWYYHCDRLGMLVWQDMPSGNPAAPDAPLWVRPQDANDGIRTQQSSDQFMDELKGMMDALSNHPSVIVWVPFNEGWGQYETRRVTEWVEEYDPSRIVNSASGWTDRGVGHLLDIHEYPGPSIEQCQNGRVPVLGEFGGLGLALPGHLWVKEGNWGYRSYDDPQRLMYEYESLIRSLQGPIAQGLSAAIYTQTTDVERETNGLITYDRAVIKLDPAALRALHAPLYDPLPPATLLVPTSESEPQGWRFTVTAPQYDWVQPDYDDSAWNEGVGPIMSRTAFRTAPKGTPWGSNEVWLRKAFSVSQGLLVNRLWLELINDFAMISVYVNGEHVATLDDRRAHPHHYRHYDVSEWAQAVQPGHNVICLHAVANEGSRGLDIGLYGVEA